MEQPKKKVILTELERKAIALQIAKRAQKDPEFKERVDKMIEEAKKLKGL